jgi:hypothetical protein
MRHRNSLFVNFVIKRIARCMQTLVFNSFILVCQCVCDSCYESRAQVRRGQNFHVPVQIGPLGLSTPTERGGRWVFPPYGCGGACLVPPSTTAGSRPGTQAQGRTGARPSGGPAGRDLHTLGPVLAVCGHSCRLGFSTTLVTLFIALPNAFFYV